LKGLSSLARYVEIVRKREEEIARLIEFLSEKSKGLHRFRRESLRF